MVTKVSWVGQDVMGNLSNIMGKIRMVARFLKVAG